MTTVIHCNPSGTLLYIWSIVDEDIVICCMSVYMHMIFFQKWATKLNTTGQESLQCWVVICVMQTADTQALLLASLPSGSNTLAWMCDIRMLIVLCKQSDAEAKKEPNKLAKEISNIEDKCKWLGSFVRINYLSQKPSSLLAVFISSQVSKQIVHRPHLTQIHYSSDLYVLLLVGVSLSIEPEWFTWYTSSLCNLAIQSPPVSSIFCLDHVWHCELINSCEDLSFWPLL